VKELFKQVIFPMVATLTVAGAILVGFDRQACKAKSISFEEYNYSAFGGCMVKEKGRWLPLENYREVLE
jgi:hypothetical protein